MPDYSLEYRARCFRIAYAVRDRIDYPAWDFALAWTDETVVVGRLRLDGWGSRFVYHSVEMEGDDDAVIAELVAWVGHAAITSRPPR